MHGLTARPAAYYGLQKNAVLLNADPVNDENRVCSDHGGRELVACTAEDDLGHQVDELVPVHGRPFDLLSSGSWIRTSGLRVMSPAGTAELPYPATR
jgi:hypothetical protein